jgi:hypothetical protein
MRLTVEQDSHVGDAKADRRDILLNLRCRFGKAGIEKDVARVTRN